MTRVLVTGAQGLLGSAFVPHLQAGGYEVLRHARKGDAEIHADLSDVKQVYSALDMAAPQVIVNLAALTSVDECERNPQLAYLANVRTVENLASWIKGHDSACYLIQLSTDQVYDGPGPHKESDITISNYYGFSKYAGELAASLVPSTILRTNFFGPSQCPSRMSLSDWLVQSLTNGDPITVFDDVQFSPLSLRRLVELLERVVARREQGVFNLGSKNGMSKADFAFTLAEVLDLPSDRMNRGTSDQVKLAAYRPKNMCMDSYSFEDVFGVELPTLKEEIQFMKVAYDKTR